MIQFESTVEEKDAKISQLTARVKGLEKEIAERVRGFLLNNRNKALRTTVDNSTQTESDPLAHSDHPLNLDLSFSPPQSVTSSVFSTPCKE